MTNQMKESIKRNVVLKTDCGSASGVVVETGFILTVCHAIEVDSRLTANGNPTTIVFALPEYDLLLLHSETVEVEPIVLSRADVTDPVYYVGNPASIINAVIQGHVIAKDDEVLYCDNAVQFGASGSGMYNKQGHLCGLVSAMKQGSKCEDHMGSAFTVCTPSHIIERFLAQALFVANAVAEAMRRQYETETQNET